MLRIAVLIIFQCIINEIVCKETNLKCSNQNCTLILNKLFSDLVITINCKEKNFTSIPECSAEKLLMEIDSFIIPEDPSTPNNYRIESFKFSLSNNSIPTIESNLLSNIPNITHLLLDYNSIINIENNAFAALKELQMLELSNNNIKTLPETFGFGANKLDLILENNPLDKINGTIFGNSINKLQLANCSLTEISDVSFSNLTSLTDLNLSKNKLNKISNVLFINNLHLQVLYLFGNNLEAIESDAFASLNKLESLYLQNNNLSFIPSDLFKTNINLKVLDLSNNKLKSIALDIFVNNNILGDLNLQNNNLLQVEYFKTENNELKIKLSQNPICKSLEDHLEDVKEENYNNISIKDCCECLNSIGNFNVLNIDIKISTINETCSNMNYTQSCVKKVSVQQNEGVQNNSVDTTTETATNKPKTEKQQTFQTIAIVWSVGVIFIELVIIFFLYYCRVQNKEKEF